jgi:oligopeptidase B
MPRASVSTTSRTLLRALRATFSMTLILSSTSGAAGAAPASTTPTPPIAKVVPHVWREHGRERVDNYHWLRDDSRKNPEMLAYLEAENAYTEAVLAPTEALQASLYDELVARRKPDDDTVPFRRDGYWYYRRFEAGSEYDRIYRRKGTLDAPEELVLDQNLLAKGHDYYGLGTYAVTPDGKTLAWSEDTVSRRQYTVRVRDLATGKDLVDVVTNTSGDLAWANDGKTFFYVEKDPVTLLGYKVRRHRLGTEPAKDPVVWEEKDKSFYTSIGKTKSGRFLYVYSQSTVSSEMRFLPADTPDGDFRVFLPRERDHEYAAEDIQTPQGPKFVVRTNWKAENFRLVTVDAATTADRATWKDLAPARDDVFIDDFEAFEGVVAIAQRSEGLRRVRLQPLDGSSGQFIDLGEGVGTTFLAFNSEQHTPTLRVQFSSMKTPASTYDVALASGRSKLVKQQPVLGGFDSANYTTERLWVEARDGVKVPVTVLYRKTTKIDGTAPLLQRAYGSYGSSSDPTFEPNVLSLVDRGFVTAIAHVRGGQEMGRRWYDDGKLQHKKNTFYDFIDVTEALVAKGYAAKDRVFALGGSAGGLLMGAIVNLRPDLYRGVVAAVPFVDVVTTMFDETIPLTSNEFDEWGNPKNLKDYEYMLSYSPYDQVTKQAYPNLLVTTGLHDSQVQYFEPAKWVAKLRTHKTDANWLLLKTNMEAGHGGKSGRFARLKDTALQYAFFLELAKR